MLHENLSPLESVEWARFSGYLAAVQLMFVRGNLELTLESAFYEIIGAVSDEQVIQWTYPATNEIEYRQQVTLENMRERISKTLSLSRVYWTPKYHELATFIETNIVDGFWHHIKACIDVDTARIVELGNNVPYVNIGEGFTYIVYSQEQPRCMILVGNWSD